MYKPDMWAIIQVKAKDDPVPVRKVLATFYGGYLGGDEWRFNSGIKSEDHDDKTVTYHGYSGAVYKCNKNAYGLSGLTQRVLDGWVEQGKKAGVTFVLEAKEDALSHTEGGTEDDS